MLIFFFFSLFQYNYKQKNDGFLLNAYLKFDVDPAKREEEIEKERAKKKIQLYPVIKCDAPWNCRFFHSTHYCKWFQMTQHENVKRFQCVEYGTHVYFQCLDSMNSSIFPRIQLHYWGPYAISHLALNVHSIADSNFMSGNKQ